MKISFLSSLSLLLPTLCFAQFPVLFEVDMNGQMISPFGVHIAGNFLDNNYDGTEENPGQVNWDPSAIAMSDDDSDGVFSVTLNLIAGVYEFVYLNGNDWNSVENVPATCIVSTSSGNTNRQIIVGGPIWEVNYHHYYVCYGQCAPCGENAVRFSVDMSDLDYNGNGIGGEPGADINPSGIHVAGNFQDWTPSSHPLHDPDGDGIWEWCYSAGVLSSIEYKYINGLDWLDPNENITGFCGQNGYRIETLSSANTVIPTVCYNSCNPCQLPVQVTFNVNMTEQLVSPNGVHIAGTFNSWNPGDPSFEMFDPDGDGIFSIDIYLAPGFYEYKFINGDFWGSEESVPSECTFGGNRTIQVDIAPLVTSSCFGSCIYPCGEGGELNLDYSVCGSTPYSPAVYLRNDGTTEATHATFYIYTSPVTIINWTGSLLPGEWTEVIFENITGVVENLVVIEVDPNGPDSNLSDNVITVDVVNTDINTTIETNTIQLDIITDSWPSEVYWSIWDAQGNEVYFGGNYAVGQIADMEAMIINQTMQLYEDGCYTFHLYDIYGDGMTWTEPYGQMSLSALNCDAPATEIAFYNGYNDGQYSEIEYPFLVTPFLSSSFGCALSEACNYDPEADCIDNSLCIIQGNPCDDNDPETNYDSVDENCNCVGLPSINTCGNDLFFSEYVEGNNNNKALEIYNPTNQTINLEDEAYSVIRFGNGSATGSGIALAGSIPPHDVRVFVLDKRNPNGTGTEVPVSMNLQALADTFVNPDFSISQAFYFNGDDAVALVKNGSIMVDLIGVIGEDPGTGWYDPNDPFQTPLTMDHTLVRKPSVFQGNSMNITPFNPNDQWLIFEADNFDHLGYHEIDCSEVQFGCTIENACNYNPDADVSDSSCLFPGMLCNDSDPNTINDYIHDDCGCYGAPLPAGTCNPLSFDWSETPNAVFSYYYSDESADISLGPENITLADGYLNQNYSQSFYINAPDGTFESIQNPGYIFEADYLALLAITATIDGISYTLDDLGLQSSCNNQGVDTDPCFYNNNGTGCITISGQPMLTGLYNITYSFELGFSLYAFGLPFSDVTTINIIQVFYVNEAPVISGCTDAQACNYDPDATINDPVNPCIYIGDPCNDGNSETIGDMLNVNCICQGNYSSFGSITSGIFESCEGDGQSETLSVVEAPQGISNFTLQWYYRAGVNACPAGNNLNGWTIIPAANGNTYTPSGFMGTRTYACYITPAVDEAASPGWMAGCAQITITGITSQNIIGNPNITPFNTYTYAVNNVNGNSYLWTVTNGAILTGQGTSVVSVMWGQNGPYEITLTESNGICSSNSTLFIVNNSCIMSVSVVSSSGSVICPSAGSTLTAVASSSNVTYQWYLNGVILNDANDETIDVFQGGNYQVVITQGDCTAVSQTLQLTSNPESSTPIVLVDQSEPGCVGGSALLSVYNDDFVSYSWSDGSSGPEIEAAISGDYLVTGTDIYGCEYTSSPVSVNFSLINVPPVCLVTVDENSGNNLIVWEPLTSDEISSYNIYKESNIADAYTFIGSVEYGQDGVFEDTNSNSAVQASRYKIAVVDTCEIESAKSSFHKTIHLTSNLGLNNVVNLIWSHYEGFVFGSYNILRGESPDNLTLLATIASNLNSYTDLNPLDLGYYMIEVVGASCDPTRSIESSKSNMINLQVNGIGLIEEELISIYPNPANDMITINVPASMIGEEYSIYDFTGRLLESSELKSEKQTVSLTDLSNGCYTIRVRSSEIKFMKIE